MISTVLIFLHIPKAAGSTVNGILTRQYGRSAYYRLAIPPEAKAKRDNLKTPGAFLGDPEYLEQIRLLSPDRLDRLRVLSGHVCYGVHEYLNSPARARYMVILRDPVERLLSEYGYLRATRPQDYTMSLEAFIRDHHWIDNLQTRMLSSSNGLMVDLPFGGCDERHLGLACQRLRGDVDLLGLQEAFDASLLLFQQMLGWKPPYYAYRNKTADRATDIESRLREYVISANRLDSALYRTGLETFERWISAHFSAAELDDRLVRFHRRNGLFSRGIAIADGARTQLCRLKPR